jgi:hypothetical protein
MSERAKNAAEMITALSKAELVEAIRLVPESAKRVIMDELLDDEETGEDVSRAWGKEIASRIDDIDSGRVKLIPYEETLARARAAIRSAR